MQGVLPLESPTKEEDRQLPQVLGMEKQLLRNSAEQFGAAEQLAVLSMVLTNVVELFIPFTLEFPASNFATNKECTSEELVFIMGFTDIAV
jgi:hypothetical protein